MIIKPNKCYDLVHELNELAQFDITNPKNYHSNIFFFKKKTKHEIHIVLIFLKKIKLNYN
jgi:hypothetical protein